MKAKKKSGQSKHAVVKKKKNENIFLHKKDYEPGEDYYYDKEERAYVKKSEIGKDTLDYDEDDRS